MFFLHPNDYYCNLSCKNVVTSRNLHLVTHFVDLDAEVYRSHSLRMALWNMPEWYSVNKVVF